MPVVAIQPPELMTQETAAQYHQDLQIVAPNKRPEAVVVAVIIIVVAAAVVIIGQRIIQDFR